MGNRGASFNRYEDALDSANNQPLYGSKNIEAPHVKDNCQYKRQRNHLVRYCKCGKFKNGERKKHNNINCHYARWKDQNTSKVYLILKCSC
ncbi:hypothetical protein EB796_011763 [Bugula neritina]|uniref:Uncharacterized protein n=1 Tax=Bugula neritina TaxID=10212 RepID=A0A7J7JVE7_BUGNE|nr:hypothetical protein EB796_011763 [Bugula neritina]